MGLGLVAVVIACAGQTASHSLHAMHLVRVWVWVGMRVWVGVRVRVGVRVGVRVRVRVSSAACTARKSPSAACTRAVRAATGEATMRVMVAEQRKKPRINAGPCHPMMSHVCAE